LPIFARFVTYQNIRRVRFSSNQYDKGGADLNWAGGDWMADFLKPMIKGGIVGAVALSVGGILAGFFAPIAPYAGIVGGAVTLYILEMFYK
jgi:hypothetical protein